MNYQIAFWVVFALLIIFWGRYSFVREQRTRLAILYNLLWREDFVSGSDLLDIVKDEGAFLLSGPKLYLMCARLVDEGLLEVEDRVKTIDGVEVKLRHYRYNPERRTDIPIPRMKIV